MSRRLLLRRHLLAAWNEVVREHYRKQQINSERGLQVFFCSCLMGCFERDRITRRIFVEPRLTTTDGERGPSPDVVVCNSNRIIGVIELKYVPRGRAAYTKDLNSLEWVAIRAASLRIRNDRYLGVPTREREYPLALDAVLCWAGIHRRGHGQSLRANVGEAAAPYFMEMHALTAEGEHPTVESSFRPRG